MNYQQALDYLYSFPDSEAKLPRTPAEFNLPQTAALLTAFGEPQLAFPSVVIAGTKGKGSTVALLEAIARASGLRTGMWTSPHLHSYRERIQVDRAPISQTELIGAIEAIPERLAGFDRQRHGEPTIFQLGFAIALRYFADRAVDLAILEVGLGGRYDSANVVTPLLSVITSISYDHMAVLGNTLSQIAWEKAGILKPGVPAITISQYDEPMATIVQVAAEVGAPLWVATAGAGSWELGDGDATHNSQLPTPSSFRPVRALPWPDRHGAAGRVSARECAAGDWRGAAAARAGPADRRRRDRRRAGRRALARADGDRRRRAADRAGWRTQRRFGP
jgi:folylpolyglutamate synthase/dihydropteroate synthase